MAGSIEGRLVFKVLEVVFLVVLPLGFAALIAIGVILDITGTLNPALRLIISARKSGWRDGLPSLLRQLFALRSQH